MQSGFLHYSFHGGLEIARGQIRRLTHVNVTGVNGFVGNTTPEFVGPIASWSPKPLELINLISTSGLDTLAGVGAQRVLIEGIGSAGLPISESIDMAGVGSSSSVLSYSMVNRVTVTQAGATGGQEGDIKAQGATSGANHCRVITDSKLNPLHEGQGQSQQAIWKVGTGQTGYITRWNVGFGAVGTGVFAGNVTFVLWLYNPDTDIWLQQASLGVGTSDQASSVFDPPLIVPAGFTAAITARSTATNSSVVAGFSLILETI